MAPLEQVRVPIALHVAPRDEASQGRACLQARGIYSIGALASMRMELALSTVEAPRAHRPAACT